eukprot:403331418
MASLEQSPAPSKKLIELSNSAVKQFLPTSSIHNSGQKPPINFLNQQALSRSYIHNATSLRNERSVPKLPSFINNRSQSPLNSAQNPHTSLQNNLSNSRFQTIQTSINNQRQLQQSQNAITTTNLHNLNTINNRYASSSMIKSQTAQTSARTRNSQNFHTNKSGIAVINQHSYKNDAAVSQSQFMNKLRGINNLLNKSASGVQFSNNSNINNQNQKQFQLNTADKQSLGIVSSSGNFGIEGYKLPTVGLPPKNPTCSIPKDKSSNFLAIEQKRARAIPAPDQYHHDASWDVGSGIFGKGAKRKTFTDEVIQRSKQLPSCASYNLEKKEKIPLGKSNKADQVDFLSEIQYVAKQQPGPASYSPKTSLLLTRSHSYKIVKPIKDKKITWKPEKSNEPDPCSYDTSNSLIFLKPKSSQIAMPKSKNIKFSMIIAKSKEFIPSSAHYQKEKCYDVISRPYMQKRL